MKTRILLIGVMMSIMTLQAQHVQVGLRNGLAISSFSEIDNLNESDHLRSGFGGGIALRYSFNNIISLQSGVNFEQKGFRNFRLGSLGNMSLQGIYEYITFPLNVEGSFPVNQSLRLFGITGPYGAAKIRTSHSVTGNFSDAVSVVPTWKVNNGEAGWIIGGGLLIPSGNHLIEAGFRYSMSLTEITPDFPDYRNKSALFSIAFYY